MNQEEKRKHFGDGEWLNEPDNVKFEHEGINCEITRVLSYKQNEYAFGGHFCGYCFLPKGHPWENNDDFEIDVHGGITYQKKDPDTGQMVVGFDCAHLHDIIPSMTVIEKKYNIEPYQPSKKLVEIYGEQLTNCFVPVYRNLEYVINECKSMSDQIALNNKK